VKLNTSSSQFISSQSVSPTVRGAIRTTGANPGRTPITSGSSAAVLLLPPEHLPELKTISAIKSLHWRGVRLPLAKASDRGPCASADAGRQCPRPARRRPRRVRERDGRKRRGGRVLRDPSRATAVNLTAAIPGLPGGGCVSLPGARRFRLGSEGGPSISADAGYSWRCVGRGQRMTVSSLLTKAESEADCAA
jgi:hypothetical protein